jgi:hypothetical protein
MRPLRLLVPLSIFALLPLAPLAFADAACSGAHTSTVLAPSNSVLLQGSPEGRLGLGEDGTGVVSTYFHLTIPSGGCILSLHVNSAALPAYSMSMHVFAADWVHHEPDPNGPDQCDGLRLNVPDYSCPVKDTAVHWVVVDGLLGAAVSVTVTVSPP